MDNFGDGDEFDIASNMEPLPVSIDMEPLPLDNYGEEYFQNLVHGLTTTTSSDDDVVELLNISAAPLAFPEIDSTTRSDVLNIRAAAAPLNADSDDDIFYN